MVQLNSHLSSSSFSPLYPTTIGFDKFFTSVEKLLSNDEIATVKFPPHNIIRLDEFNYVIEMAVAGFSEDELELTAQENTLTVRGEKKQDRLVKGEYLHRGVSLRTFVKSFQLSDLVEIRKAECKDGMLRIRLENVIPESHKPRKISLTASQ